MRLILLMSLVFSGFVSAEEVNYCHDKETNQQWDRMVIDIKKGRIKPALISSVFKTSKYPSL